MAVSHSGRWKDGKGNVYFGPNHYIWLDPQGNLHIDIPTLLRQVGLPDTPSTREVARQAALKAVREVLPEASVLKTIQSSEN
jgi:hypothetical protein